MTPEDNRYAKSHEYVHPDAEGDVVVIGITDYAQKELGDVVFVELPQVGTELKLGAEFGSIENVRDPSALISPVSGEVVEVNEALNEKPELVNTDPYGDGWMMKMRLSVPKEIEEMMTAEEYVEYVEYGDDEADEGKATVRFEIGESGLHIIYPRTMLAQATLEARAEARDPEKSTPVRNGASHVQPLHVAELLDGAAALSTLLESAQLVQNKPANLDGRPAHLLSFKLVPKLSTSSKNVKKVESALSVWVGDDGTPLAAEEKASVKASFFLISFEADQKHNWTYARNGDRLVVTRFESNDKSDGLGQHSTSRTVETVRLE